MKMGNKLVKLKKMNKPSNKTVFTQIILMLILVVSACETNLKTAYNLPALPNLPEKRSPLMHNSVEYANKVAIEMAEKKYCNCVRTSEKSTWKLCQQIADNEMKALSLSQQDLTIKYIMQNTYDEVKERCKVQVGIKPLPK